MPPRNSVCDKKQIGFATRSTRMEATKRFSRKSQPRWGTRETSCRSHFSHNVCRSDYCVNIEDCEALLFGTAGFLETSDLDIYKKSAREYVRQLWDHWWPHRDDMQRFILSAKAWHISGTRPLNHPQRRLAALAVLVREWPRLQRASGKSSVAAANDFLQTMENSFWNFHYTLTSKTSPKEMALIGKARASDILANVLFPFWAAHELKTPGSPSAPLWAEYTKLPAQLSNRRLETGATRLFGNDPRRTEFLRTIAHQQGLLQIYEDFCMQDNSDCSQCPFPEQMANWA